MTLPVPKSSELPDPDSEAAERRPDLDGLLLLLEVANPGFLHGMEDALEAAHPDGPQAYGRPLSGRRPRKGGLWTWTPENGSQERREQKARTLGSSSKTPVAKPDGTKMFCSAFLNDARMCCFFANAIVKY